MNFSVSYGRARRIVQGLAAALLIALTPAAAQTPPRALSVLAFGDSLTAGYRLPKGQGFAPQLQDALRRNGIAATVTDGGVSGDTAAAARARLGWTLDGMKAKPDLAIVALGGNDMLRALPPAQTRADMDAIVAELRKREIPVLVAGMLAAPNMGPDYSAAFNPIFPEVAARHGAALYPFFLAQVAGDRRLNLEDGIHPNFLGIKRMVTGILPSVMKGLGA
ncbi:arylesterase [Allosphingosinicella indica]|uniref:Acyl-CoA thioesterase-1 n=1 Tax=Allosphingosinicella indica TaxID=941907 RepID=A0A1X7G7S0_9SPHN|nr:arylesterase [Allosphingosinicella indica]SMF65475.1 acyl-CoA thioesterase-1 [Allosphingosinicella indica]